MDIIRAKEIIEALSQGINPITGEIISKDNICNQGEIVRAFYCILNELNNIKLINSQKPIAENAGAKWNDNEDIELSRKFDQGIKISQIAKEHKRSRGAITSRLSKLGKIGK